MAESYIVEEAIEFCSDFLENVHSIGFASKENKKEELTKALSAISPCTLTREELAQAHLHVLTNDPEIDPYIEYVIIFIVL